MFARARLALLIAGALVLPVWQAIAGQGARPAQVYAQEAPTTRLDGPGSLDLGFGTRGLVTTDLGGAIDLPAALLLQSDGKIVLVGTTAPGWMAYERIAVARYTPDG